jgi:hypothetical protein
MKNQVIVLSSVIVKMCIQTRVSGLECLVSVIFLQGDLRHMRILIHKIPSFCGYFTSVKTGPEALSHRAVWGIYTSGSIFVYDEHCIKLDRKTCRRIHRYPEKKSALKALLVCVRPV